MKYYTVETLAMSIDPNRNYTAMEIEGLYQDYLSNLDGTVEFYRDIDRGSLNTVRPLFL